MGRTLTAYRQLPVRKTVDGNLLSPLGLPSRKLWRYPKAHRRLFFTAIKAGVKSGYDIFGRRSADASSCAYLLRSLRLIRLRRLDRRGTQGHAEADLVIAVRRNAVATCCRTAKHCGAAATAATVHTTRAPDRLI